MVDCTTAGDRIFRTVCGALCAALLAAMGAGCERVDLNTYYTSLDRMDKGLVVILPGIEGESAANQDIRRGLDEAGVPYALAIYRWGFPLPGIGLYMNQTDTAGNRRAARELAERIVQYQTNFPGRPVFLSGHSAGGGEVVFTLEALGELGAEPVEGAFLLAASISSEYPLHAAMRMTRRGLVNVYNPEDDLLNTGAVFFGNVDGGHAPSAGRAGFQGRYEKLFQLQITGAEIGILGSPHYIATNASLIAEHGPLWLNSDTWPPPPPGQ